MEQKVLFKYNKKLQGGVDITNFKCLIKNNSIKQENIASVVKCSQAAISKWCNGKSEPSLNAVIKMSQAFDIPIEEIVMAFKKEDSVSETALEGQIKFSYID